MKSVQAHMKMGKPSNRMEDLLQKRKEISINLVRSIQGQAVIKYNLFRKCQLMLRVPIHLFLVQGAIDSTQQIRKSMQQ